MGPKTPESDGPPRRVSSRHWLRTVLLAGLTVGALACIAAAFLGLLLYLHITQPGQVGAPVRIRVPEGAAGKDIGNVLAEAGLVEHELVFRLALRLDKTPKPIRYGRYEVPLGLSALEIADLLQEGRTLPPDPSEIPDELKVTVPEGLTLAQTAELFDNPDAFLEAARDPALIRRIGIEAPSLEGFLMPDTYYFDAKPTEREVVERMAAQFEKVYAELVAGNDPPQDKLATVTIASLVEEESRVPEERPAVAAVIQNRIKKQMPLQLDSTLQYALGKYGQRLLYSDREVDSPYNTYRNRGLPPGPISSPGVSSLRAALNPAQVDYLYFVSNADGRTHTFSSTDAEHQQAVSRFRRLIAPQRRSVSEESAGAAAPEPGQEEATGP